MFNATRTGARRGVGWLQVMTEVLGVGVTTGVLEGGAVRWLAVTPGRREKTRNMRIRGKSALFTVGPLIRSNGPGKD
jgi:hypothetical protein